jgi:NAD(P)-dependent dehydrogenase (short-subunit alcohol dehydrogenase family)
MLGDLTGKAAIVTGAGQGIGPTIVAEVGSTLPERQVVMDGFYG